MLDVKRLRILREVSARGSFSAAAEELYLSQSAVSQQVATLEREVGMTLLERTSSGPKLTDAGRALVAHADAVICRLDEAERELAAIAGLEGGRVRLVSFPTANATLVTRAVSSFRERYPAVELQLGRGRARAVGAGAQARRLRPGPHLRLRDRARSRRPRHRADPPAGGADPGGAAARTSALSARARSSWRTWPTTTG